MVWVVGCLLGVFVAFKCNFVVPLATHSPYTRTCPPLVLCMANSQVHGLPMSNVGGVQWTNIYIIYIVALVQRPQKRRFTLLDSQLILQGHSVCNDRFSFPDTWWFYERQHNVNYDNCSYKKNNGGSYVRVSSVRYTIWYPIPNQIYIRVIIRVNRTPFSPLTFENHFNRE